MWDKTFFMWLALWVCLSAMKAAITMPHPSRKSMHFWKPRNSIAGLFPAWFLWKQNGKRQVKTWSWTYVLLQLVQSFFNILTSRVFRFKQESKAQNQMQLMEKIKVHYEKSCDTLLYIFLHLYHHLSRISGIRFITHATIAPSREVCLHMLPFAFKSICVYF